MRKSKKIFLLMMILLTTLLVSCKKNTNIVETFPEKITNLTSYKLVGKLETMFPTGTKECEVTAYYQKPDLYRVEIKNPNVEELQVIIKNAEGVFVVVPSINKTFKVNGTWPINSSYPYLLQSLSKDIVNDTELTTDNNGTQTTLELKAKVFNNANPTKQKIIFDNETKLPTEVLMYDDEDNLFSRFVFNLIEENPKLENDLFVVNTTINTIRLNYESLPIEYERIITYPTYFQEGTSKTSEVITGGPEDKQVVMVYSGTTNLTIIEKFVNDVETTKTEYLSGDIYIMGGTVGIITDNILKFYDNGTEYTIASQTIDMYEIIKTAQSLRVTEEK